MLYLSRDSPECCIVYTDDLRQSGRKQEARSRNPAGSDCTSCWIQLPKLSSRSCSTIVIKSSCNSNHRKHTVYKYIRSYIAALISGGIGLTVVLKGECLQLKCTQIIVAAGFYHASIMGNGSALCEVSKELIFTGEQWI